MGLGSNIQLNFLLVFLFLLAASCGKKEKLEIKYHFSNEHDLSKGDQDIYREMGRLEKASIHNDFDWDGIPDLYDLDLDDDGHLNYADQYPFDIKKWGEDIDNDGITDFFDIEVLGIYKYGLANTSAKIQKRLFIEKSILLISGNLAFTKNELIHIQKEFFENTLAKIKSFDKLKIIYKNPKNYELTKFAEYNTAWKTISLYHSNYFKNRIYNFSNSLVHEVFHSIERSDQNLYKAFLKISGWKESKGGYEYNSVFLSNYDLKNNLLVVGKQLISDDFPSEYSKAGPREMFAESGSAYNILFKLNKYPLRVVYDYNKYKYLTTFRDSAVFKLFDKHLKLNSSK